MNVNFGGEMAHKIRSKFCSNLCVKGGDTFRLPVFENGTHDLFFVSSYPVIGSHPWFDVYSRMWLITWWGRDGSIW